MLEIECESPPRLFLPNRNRRIPGAALEVLLLLEINVTLNLHDARVFNQPQRLFSSDLIFFPGQILRAQKRELFCQGSAVNPSDQIRELIRRIQPC